MTLETHRPGTTVVLLIVSSDKTQLMHFRGKSTYLVYLTIGNVPKNIHRKPSHHAQVLLAYIPTTKFNGIPNKAGRRRAIANLYHGCMQALLDPIKAIGITGVPMLGRDGIWR